MQNASECFLTSSTKEIVPIVKIDGKTIADGLPGAMTHKLHALYKEFIHHQIKKDKQKYNWPTPKY